MRQRIGRLIGLPTSDHRARSGWLTGMMLLAALISGGMIAVGCVGNGGERGLPLAGEYDKATITFYDYAAGAPPATHQFTVERPQELRELLAFFPQLGRKSNRAGLWKAGAVVEIRKPGGEIVRIMLSGNDELRTWSEGQGDWPVEGDFSAYVARLKAAR